MNSITPNSFVAISDIHSTEWVVDKIEKYYINEYDKIFILGDAVDRGPNGNGEESFKILNRIYELYNKYPNRIIYVPGNHDHMLFKAINGDQQSISLMQINGGSGTYDTYINRYKGVNGRKKGKRIDEILDWLSKQPLQRIHTFAGKKYVFAHAFFNQEFYGQFPDFCFNDFKTTYLNHVGKEAIQQILWFRKDNPNYYSKYDPRYLPDDGSIMVIGHTPPSSRMNDDLDLINENGEKVKVICVDGGAFKNKSTIKYDGRGSGDLTYENTHNDTSPKSDILFVEPKYYDDSKDNNLNRYYRDIINNDKSKENINSDSDKGSNEELYNSVIDFLLNQMDEKKSINQFIVEFFRCSNENSFFIKMFKLNTFFNDKNIDLLTNDSNLKTLAKQIIPIIDKSFGKILYEKYTSADYINKVLLDYIIDCLEENGYNSVKYLNALFLDGDYHHVTRYGDARKIAKDIGVKRLKLVLESSNCNTIEEYVENYIKNKNNFADIKNRQKK